MEKFLRLFLWCCLLFSLLAVMLPYILGVATGLFALHMVCSGIPPKYALIGFLFVVVSVATAIKGTSNDKKE